MSAIRETLSTLKFAQRAKMIKNKAIVNEENSDAEYWRQKYLALLRMGNGSVGTGTNSLASRADHMMIDERSNRNSGLNINLSA